MALISTSNQNISIFTYGACSNYYYHESAIVNLENHTKYFINY